jgi:uncharacterized tellurite resistance protein B-like protein
MSVVSIREAAKTRLTVLVGKVMADGQVDEGEREDLRKAFTQQVLSPDDVRAAMSAYLEDFKTRVLADGTVTADETRRCQALVDQLRIPLRLLPPELLDIVLGKKK